MGFLHRIVFGESALSKNEKLVIIKCLSCVIWFDGNFHKDEGQVIVEITKELKGIPENEILKVLSTIKSFSPELEEEIKNLPEVQAHSLLKYVYRIARADGEIDSKELEGIKKISELLLPDKNWNLVLDWIESNDRLIKSTRALFGTV